MRSSFAIEIFVAIFSRGTIGKAYVQHGALQAWRFWRWRTIKDELGPMVLYISHDDRSGLAFLELHRHEMDMPGLVGEVV